MTPSEFIEKLQGYYGLRYTEGTALVIGPYVKTKSPAFLSSLFDKVVRKHSQSFKCLPGMAEFSSVENEVFAEIVKLTPDRGIGKYIAEANDITEEERQAVIEEYNLCMAELFMKKAK